MGLEFICLGIITVVGLYVLAELVRHKNESW
jgi:hypothetical protein